MKKAKNQKIKQKAISFLKSSNTMVIATVSEDGLPQASTVYYTTDDDFNLFFVTYPESKKYQNLKQNKKVAFVIGLGPQVLIIQGGGIAEEIVAGYEKIYDRILEHALKPVDQWPPLVLSKTHQSVFKITPSWMVCLNLHKENYKDEVNGDFYKII